MPSASFLMVISNSLLENKRNTSFFLVESEKIVTKICLFQKNALYLQRLILKYDYGRA